MKENSIKEAILIYIGFVVVVCCFSFFFVDSQIYERGTELTQQESKK